MLRILFLAAVFAVPIYGALAYKCKTDLRFCPGPVACQVWQ